MASRLGLGLAAVGRPAYITAGRAGDLPDRSVAGMRSRAHELLDAAYAGGVRYIDVARSYGRAEEFLAGWLADRVVPDLVVGSKWGYTYVGDWRLDAETHEVKEHTLGAFRRQWAESRALLGDRIRLYQVHSATLESGALDDRSLHAALAEVRDSGVVVGVTTSGPRQAAAVRKAIAIEHAGQPLFRCVQSTWNLLEPSVGPALAEAADAGCGVIVKEAVANGLLTDQAGSPLSGVAHDLGSTVDAVAIAAALAQPGVTVVLSGAATVDQLMSNLEARTLPPFELPDVALSPEDYWSARSDRSWT
ncbi:MAG: aldo/keto reductase [Actinomycetes bacterium]